MLYGKWFYPARMVDQRHFFNFGRWEESICLWLPAKETTDWILDHTDSGLVTKRIDLGKSTSCSAHNLNLDIRWI